MTKTLLCAILLAATALSAETVRITPGDRVRVRCDAGTIAIAGGDGDIVRAPRVRRVDAHVLEVNASGEMTIDVPRSVAVEWLTDSKARANVRDVAALHVDARGGTVVASRIAGNVDGKTANGNVTARDVGGNVVISTGNGNIDVDGVRGLVDVTSGNGNTTVTNVRNGVHVTSINGKTEISRVAGSVDVNDTSGRTTVSAVAGDVALFTALGVARYDGALQPGRSYRLRTLDGAVTLAIAPGGSGYFARLASDAARIEITPPLTSKEKRVELRVGDESARVVLDAVGGRVTLIR